MLYATLFPRDVFAQLNHLLDSGSTPQALAPALNVSTTPDAVEVNALLPGLNPACLDIQLDRGVLSIAGERPAPAAGEAGTRRVGERFAGRFHRTLSLPDDVDPGAVDASYRDGVLRIHLQRRAAPTARRINVQ